jgi:hypothetical protein
MPGKHCKLYSVKHRDGDGAEPDTDTDTDTETEGWSVCKVTHDTATSRFGVDSTFPILFL